MGKGIQHKVFITVPSALGIIGVDVSRGKSAVVPGREAWWTWGGMLSHRSPGILAPILTGPAPQGGEWLLLLGLQWPRGLSCRPGWDGHLGPIIQEPLHGQSGPGPCCELSCCCLAGVGTNYLLEEARATDPAPSLGARSAAGAWWSSRTAPASGLARAAASLQGASWSSPGWRGFESGARRPGGCAEAGGTGQPVAEGLSSSSPSTAVHAEEQTVKGGKTRLGAFLGAGGVGG